MRWKIGKMCTYCAQYHPPLLFNNQYSVWMIDQIFVGNSDQEKQPISGSNHSRFVNYATFIIHDATASINCHTSVSKRSASQKQEIITNVDTRHTFERTGF